MIEADISRTRSGRRGEESAQDSSLGAVVRSLRLARGLTTRQLAEQSDISHGYLSKVERGTVRRPADSVIKGLADALAIPSEELAAHLDLPSATIGNVHKREPSYSRDVPKLAIEKGYDEWPERHRVYPAPATGPLNLALVRQYLEQAKWAHFHGDVPLAIEQLRMGLLTLEHLALPPDDLVAEGHISQVHVRDIHIELLYRLAEYELDVRHSSAALSHVEQALMLRLTSGNAGDNRKERGLSVPTAHLFRSRAAIKVALGWWKDAEADFDRSLSMAVSNKLLNIEAVCFTTLAWFRMHQGRYGDAQGLLEKGMQLKEEFGAGPRSRAFSAAMSNTDPLEARNDNVMTAWASYNVQVLRADPPDLWHLEEALKGQQEALRAFEESLDARNAADVQLRLAHIHTRLAQHYQGQEASDHFDVAEWLARRSLAYGEHFDMALPQIEARRQLGQTLQTRGNLDEANKQMQLALRLIDRIEDPYVAACVQKAAGSVLLDIVDVGGADQSMTLRRAEDLLKSAETILGRLGATEQLRRARLRLERHAELAERSNAANQRSVDEQVPA